MSELSPPGAVLVGDGSPVTNPGSERFALLIGPSFLPLAFCGSGAKPILSVPICRLTGRRPGTARVVSAVFGVGRGAVFAHLPDEQCDKGNGQDYQGGVTSEGGLDLGV
jgi:hypothetical protein